MPADHTPPWVLQARQRVGNRIEQGHASPKPDTLLQIADALRIDLADLVRQPDG